MDDRGRTVTVFERLPKFDRGITVTPDEQQKLHFDVVIDQPNLDRKRSREGRKLLVDGLSKFLDEFFRSHNRCWLVPEDAEAIATAIEDILAASGRELIANSELAELKNDVLKKIETEPSKFIGSTDAEAGPQERVFVDAAALKAHLLKHGTLNFNEVSVTAQFVGEPLGESRWAV
ncbi:hypothetical protein [Mycobacterium haemophilum]|uniref:hypothetical protein n=1 Tax=Mycobacterium haemophilum TaxID=29311 RepID=UPI0012E05A3F|nr:hypothetical protein [Mycobacterium haemophilum]